MELIDVFEVALVLTEKYPVGSMAEAFENLRKEMNKTNSKIAEAFEGMVLNEKNRRIE